MASPNQSTPPTGSDVFSSAVFQRFLGKAADYVRQPTRMKQLLTDAYKKASEKNDIGTLAHEAWDTLQTLFRLVRSAAGGDYTGVPGTTIAAAVAVLLYFLSPIDLIPDFIPVVGLLDDVALLAWFSTTVKGEIDKFHEWELTRPALVLDAGSTAQPSRTADEMFKHQSESAKYAGTTDHPAAAPHVAVSAPTTDGSRVGNRDAATDAGGNVR